MAYLWSVAESWALLWVLWRGQGREILWDRLLVLVLAQLLDQKWETVSDLVLVSVWAQA
jgi:hypothetical protein